MLLRVSGRKFTPMLAAREAWSLARYVYPEERRLRLFKQQARWAAAASIKPNKTMEWFHLLRNSELREYAEINRRLFFKPLRVYMSSKWSIEQKIKTICDTYNFIRIFVMPLQNALLRGEDTILSTIPIADNHNAYLILGYDNKYRKEGELVVSLRYGEQGPTIASMVFSLGQQENSEWTMYIGCIQGGSAEATKAREKSMYGLRPKAFMVIVAQGIAHTLGIKHISGVGNAIHAHNKKHIIHFTPVHGLSFCYDTLWADAGGELVPSGWFKLPSRFQPRSHNRIKSNKRSMYAHRYNMLDNVFKQIQSSLREISSPL